MAYLGPAEINAEESLLLYEHRATSGTLYPGDVYNNVVVLKLIDEVNLKFSHSLAKNQSFDDKLTTTRIPTFKQSGITGSVYTFLNDGVLYYLYNENLVNLDTNIPSDIQKTALRDPETYGFVLAWYTREGIRKKIVIDNKESDMVVIPRLTAHASRLSDKLFVGFSLKDGTIRYGIVKTD